MRCALWGAALILLAGSAHAEVTDEAVSKCYAQTNVIAEIAACLRDESARDDASRKPPFDWNTFFEEVKENERRQAPPAPKRKRVAQTKRCC